MLRILLELFLLTTTYSIYRTYYKWIHRFWKLPNEGRYNGEIALGMENK
jgi:hypothetical protein